MTEQVEWKQRPGLRERRQRTRARRRASERVNARGVARVRRKGFVVSTARWRARGGGDRIRGGAVPR
eukprot:4565048-Pleurochrysis_carterae.AAC.1